MPGPPICGPIDPFMGPFIGRFMGTFIGPLMGVMGVMGVIGGMEAGPMFIFWGGNMALCGGGGNIWWFG